MKYLKEKKLYCEAKTASLLSECILDALRESCSLGIPICFTHNGDDYIVDYEKYIDSVRSNRGGN
jgi:hypothetical protein